MKVYVLYSECAFNGAVIHGVYSEPPTVTMVNEAAMEAARGMGGYQNTQVEDRIIDESQPLGS
jgi:hypothetical protein